jgi:hypothetical protein
LANGFIPKLFYQQSTDAKTSSLVNLNGTVAPEIAQNRSMRVFIFFMFGIRTKHAEQRRNPGSHTFVPVVLGPVVHYLENAHMLDARIQEIIYKTIEPIRCVEIRVAGVENAAPVYIPTLRQIMPKPGPDN